MACVPTPTATLFTTVTTSSVTTSFSQSVTTLADSTSTILSTTCLATASASNGTDTTCNSVGTVTQLSTIPGGTSTATVTVPVTVPVTLTEATATLFASCSSSTSSSSSSTSSSTSTSSTSTSSPTSTPSSSSQTSTTSTTASSSASNNGSASQTLSSITILSTPPPTVITSQAPTTLADGVVTFTQVTLTTTLPPSSVVVPTEVNNLNPSLNSSTDGNNNAHTDIGAIIGGLLGGFFGLIALVGLLWYLWRRRIRLINAAFEEESSEEGKSLPFLVRSITKSRRRQLDIDGDANPRPYEYGLVGSNTAPTPSASSSPPLNPTQPALHSRSPSLTPLILSAAANASLGPSQPTTASTSRPGTSGSFFPPVTMQADDAAAGAPVPFLSSRSSSTLGFGGGQVQMPERERRNSRPSLTLNNSSGILTRPESGLFDAHASSSPGSPSAEASSPRRPQLQVMNATTEHELLSTVDADTAHPELLPTTPPAEASGSVSDNLKRQRRSSTSPNVIVHQDGGRPQQGSSSRNGMNSDDPPPAYSS